MQEIYLGAGCFWGTQYFFDSINGVTETEVGYSGGKYDNPTYEDVCYKETGHAEVCRVVFDESVVSLEEIVKYFFKMHDPTLVNRQGPDIGTQYRSIILYTTTSQKDVIDEVVLALSPEYSKPFATEITALKKFWPAEDYHQKFTKRTGRGACHVSPSDLRI